MDNIKYSQLYNLQECLICNNKLHHICDTRYSCLSCKEGIEYLCVFTGIKSNRLRIINFIDNKLNISISLNIDIYNLYASFSYIYKDKCDRIYLRDCISENSCPELVNINDVIIKFLKLRCLK